MKVLLLQQFAPREPRTPIPLMDLAAYGRKFGHYIDVGYADDELVDVDSYDVVGLSAVAFSQEVLSILTLLRKERESRILLGGKATNALQSNDMSNLDDLGIEIFKGPGEYLFNDDIQYDDYPVWEERDFRKLDRQGWMTEAMTSRGCPYHCNFCHNTEPRVRFFSTDRVAATADLILNKIGRHRVFWVDDVFALQAKRMRDILSACDKRKIDIRKRTSFFVHISQLNREKLDLIKQYDPLEVQVGIESGDDGMLKAMGKTFTAAEAENKLREMHSYGIRAACLFLIGFPTESKESLRNTIDFANRTRKLMSGIWVSQYQPVPFTKGWEMVKERTGHTIDGGWNTNICYVDPNLEEKDLIRAAYLIRGENPPV